MLKVGLSGKIASGKSEVESILREFNYPVYDLDELSRDIFDEEKEAILKEFQTLDRKKIAEIIFTNLGKKEILENIIYPKLKEKIFEIFKKNAREKIVFISGALLFKSGFYKFFNKTIFIEADDKIRLERLMKRNNLSYEVALSRINLQDEGNQANFVIQNNEDKNKLKLEVEKALKLLI